MINPALTIFFDLFIIGSALAVGAGMLAEYFVARQPHIGSMRPPKARRSATLHRFPGNTRRAA